MLNLEITFQMKEIVMNVNKCAMQYENCEGSLLKLFEGRVF